MKWILEDDNSKSVKDEFKDREAGSKSCTKHPLGAPSQVSCEPENQMDTLPSAASLSQVFSSK